MNPTQPVTRWHRRIVSHCTRIFRLGGLMELFFFLAQCFRREDIVKFNIRSVPHPFFARRFHTDLDVMWGVFGKRECEVESLSVQPQFIIDGGANAGFTTAFFAHKYPNAQVVAVEPAPENCEMIKRNCVSFANVRLVQGGIWTSSASLKISNPEAQSFAFQLREVSASDKDSMKGVTIPDLLKLSPTGFVDILKLDIEGAERQLFAGGYEEWIDKVRTIIVELHDDICRKALLNALTGRRYKIQELHEKVVIQFCF